MKKAHKLVSAVLVSTMVLSMTACGSGEKTYKVGILQQLEHPALDQATQGFEDVLKEKLGDNVKFDLQNAQNEQANASTIANNFVSSNVDLILANATTALQACAAATTDIPILGTSVTDYATALEISDEEVKRVCRLAQADGFVNEFPNGYETMIVQGGNNVSGGQKQRLCIARALLKKPKILILDDSTSAVDTKTDALIRKAFREEIPDTTKIIIAQRVSSIEDADQIIVLDDGKIAGVGTSEELLQTNEIYREVYESQVKGGEEDE